MLLGIVAILTGFFIAFDFLLQWEPRLEKMRTFVENYAKYLGIIAIFMGVWKFFGPEATLSASGFVADGVGPRLLSETQPFIGDLFPALFVFVGGICLNPKVFNIFNIDEPTKDKWISYLVKSKLVLGIGNMILGLIHLMIPGSSLF